MATTARLPRKLAEKIDGKEVYVKDLLNEDLEQVDEINDEYDELEREKRKLADEIRDTEDANERKELRAQVRGLSREQRALDMKMLGLYIEDKDGNPFEQDTLANVPVRAQTALMKEASEKIFGGDEGPTPGTSASG